MAGPAEFKTIITADDQSGDGWASYNSRSKKAQSQAVKDADEARKKIDKEWKGHKDKFDKVTAPARVLSPSMDRMFGTLEKLGKVGFYTAANFRRPSGSTATSGDRLSPDEVKAAGREAMTGGRINFQPPKIRMGAASEAGAVEGAASEAGGLASAAGEVATAAEGAAVGLGAVTLGLGAVVLGAAAAGVAIEVLAAKFSSKFARSAQEVENAALSSGVDPKTLQRWRGLAERNGLGAGAADSALGGLGMTIHNLQYGIDPSGGKVANILQQSGVNVGAPGSDIDYETIIKTIAKRTEGMNSFARINYLRDLHLESLAPLIARGPDAITSGLGAVDRTGVVMSDGSLKTGEGQAERLTNFEQSTRGLGNRFGELASNVSAPGIDAAAATVQGVSGGGDAVAGRLRTILGVGQHVTDAATRVLGNVSGGLAHAASDASHALTNAGGLAPSAVTASRALATLPAAVQAVHAMVERAHDGAGPRRSWPGLKSDVNGYIEKAATQYGLDPEELRRVAYQESGFSTKVKAGSSTAQGLFQFTKGTWLETLRKHGGDPGVGYGREAEEITLDAHGRPHVADPQRLQQLLDLRGNGQLNAFMGAAYRADNAKTFRDRFGRDPTQGEQYGLHMLGPGGEAALVRAGEANPGQNAAAVLPDAADSNRSVFYKHGQPVTVADLEAFLDKVAAREPREPPPPQAVEVTIITRGQPVTTVVSARNGPQPKTHRMRGPSGGE